MNGTGHSRDVQFIYEQTSFCKSEPSSCLQPKFRNQPGKNRSLVFSDRNPFVPRNQTCYFSDRSSFASRSEA